MGTSILVSEQEYLTTSYKPEYEYDEGVLLDRHVGEQPHGTAQRIRIAPRKYRIPDVSVYKEPAPRDRVIRWMTS